MSSDKVHAGQGAQIKAAALLVTEGALVELSAADARQVVGYMQPQRVSAGRVVIRAGDARRNDFMALVLDGEVTVENAPGAMHESMVVSVLGPGSLIGEMGLLDGEPRSASCTAVNTVRCAILTRDALNQLLNDDPRTAAKLMMAISLRIAERMRESADKLKLYAQLTQAMQEEINNLMPL